MSNSLKELKQQSGISSEKITYNGLLNNLKDDIQDGKVDSLLKDMLKHPKMQKSLLTVASWNSGTSGILPQ